MIKWIRAILISMMIVIVFFVASMTVGLFTKSMIDLVVSFPVEAAISTAVIMTGFIAYVIRDDV